MFSCLALSVSAWEHRTVISLTLERPGNVVVEVKVMQFLVIASIYFVLTCLVELRKCVPEKLDVSEK